MDLVAAVLEDGPEILKRPSRVQVEMIGRVLEASAGCGMADHGNGGRGCVGSSRVFAIALVFAKSLLIARGRRRNTRNKIGRPGKSASNAPGLETIHAEGIIPEAPSWLGELIGKVHIWQRNEAR